MLLSPIHLLVFFHAIQDLYTLLLKFGLLGLGQEAPATYQQVGHTMRIELCL